MSKTVLQELSEEEKKLVPRSAWAIQRSVLFALLIRELRTRFYGYRLGYLWALIEPGMHVTLLSLAASSIRSRNTIYEVDVPVFIAMGILPFFMFRVTFNNCLNSFNSGRGLYVYKQVKPLDMLLAQAMFEMLSYLSVFVLFLLILSWIGFTIPLNEPLKLFAALGLLCLFTVGSSMIIAVASANINEVRKFAKAFNRPMYWISGCFFTIEMIPEEARIYLLWNPILHANDLIKDAMIAQYDSPASWMYLSMVAGFSILFGLMLYRQNLTKIVMT